MANLQRQPASLRGLLGYEFFKNDPDTGRVCELDEIFGPEADRLFYGVGPSFSVYRSDRLRFAPIAELIGWRVLNGNQTAADPDAGGTNIVNLKLGARTVFARGSVYVGYGFALTEQSWYDDVLRFEYRVEF